MVDAMGRRHRGYWTQERVLAVLGALDRRGVRMTPPDLKASGRADVVWATYRLFGSFGKARRAAGLKKPARRRWSPVHTKTDARAALRALATNGIAPRQAALPIQLRRSLRTHYGTLATAIERAGLHPANNVRWTQEAISRRLRALYRRGIRTASQMHASGNTDLVVAIYRHGGSMPEARKLAGLPTTVRRRRSARP